METTKAQTFALERPKGSPTALAELIDAARRGVRKLRARGLFGAARGQALAQLALSSKRPLVCIEPDEEAADEEDK